VHRIFDKLGVRSRNAIKFQALLEQRDQATSAIDGAGSGEGSSLL
jgi:hypothetical protein